MSYRNFIKLLGEGDTKIIKLIEYWMDEVIIVHDIETTEYLYVSSNVERISGLDPNQMIGMNEIMELFL